MYKVTLGTTGCMGALALSMVLAAGPVNAMHISDACAAELNALEIAIDDSVFIGRRADSNQSNLQAKLDAADAKVGLEKFSDAVDKLMEISDKATALANAPKPKLESAVGINQAASAAIVCVGALPPG